MHILPKPLNEYDVANEVFQNNDPNITTIYVDIFEEDEPNVFKRFWGSDSLPQTFKADINKKTLEILKIFK